MVNHKHIVWSEDVIDPIITRSCSCEGCPHCKHRLSATNMYCSIFGQYRCIECKDYRCLGCLYSNVCNYCKRIT